MKFRTLTLCLAGVVCTAIAASADHTSEHKAKAKNGKMNGRYATPAEIDAYYRSNMNGRDLAVDPVTGYSLYAGEWIYDRQVLFPEVPAKREVAARITEIIEAQRREAAHLTAMVPRARTAGFSNVSTVYDYMAQDHMRLADYAANWLTRNGYPVPPEPAVVPAADMAPEASVEHQIHMHTQAFNKMLDQRKGERSSTVRGIQLWAASTAARHISLLNTLDRDIEIGRKSLSARLEAQLSGTLVASSSQSELMTRIIEEERIYFQSLNPPPPPYVPPVVAEVPRPVETPRVVQQPPPAVEAPRVVQQPAPPPAVVPMPQPRPVVRAPYRPTTRVAGQRQTRRRARRPAH